MKSNTYFMSSTQFMQWVNHYYPDMPSSDPRPYKTVWRYITNAGNLIRPEGDGVTLVKKHMRDNLSAGTYSTLIMLLDQAERLAESAARKAKSCFMQQCVEEDLEEIHMLKEEWRSHNIIRTTPLRCNVIPFHTSRGTAMPSFAEEGREPSPEYRGTAEVEAFADQMSKQWEEDKDGFFSNIAAAF